MSDLNRALVDIRSIRRQVAETTQFRGYGPSTLFATCAVAVLAGELQSRWLPRPADHPAQYIALWLSIGVFCATLIATQMFARANRLHSFMADDMIRLAVTQFLPAGIAGTILPFVLLHVDSSLVWMLPGLWQLLFSLGAFACCRSLPQPMLWVAVWFFCTGIACLLLGDARALLPVAMAGPYALGMASVAFIHFHFARRNTDDEEV